MAGMETRLESLWESLRSSSPQRYVYAAEVAYDLYSLCIEQITESELGEWTILTKLYSTCNAWVWCEVEIILGIYNYVFWAYYMTAPLYQYAAPLCQYTVCVRVCV